MAAPTTGVASCGCGPTRADHWRSDAGRIGHWRSEAGRIAYAASYAAAMRLLPTPADTRDVPTRFGTVRVYRFDAGGDGGVPALLLPGRSSGAPMWAANLPDLAARRTCYALDVLGDAGMSVQTSRLRDAADQAAWLDTSIAALDLPRVHLVGHSFGGWLAASYAVHHPERVATLTLLEPVLVFAGLRWQIYLKSLPASIMLLPRSWRSRMLAGIGGAERLDPDDPIARLVSDATEHYAARLPQPLRLRAAQLRTLRMPVHVALAGASALHDAAAAADTARSVLPDRQVRVWPDATHSLPMEYPHQLDDEILQFLTGAGR